MSTSDITVVDYGVGNLLSVRRALEHCGARVAVTSDTDAIRHAPRVLLPGVGAFANGIAELRKDGLDEIVREVAAQGTPLLGVCLGMQMLFDESEEFGATNGLGLIPGRVVALPSTTDEGERQKIPHIGWNALVTPNANTQWCGTVLEDVTPGDAVYFVHSFAAQPTDESVRLADCRYGVRVSAVVARDNVIGFQFHPEKSGEVGLKLLRRFLTL